MDAEAASYWLSWVRFGQLIAVFLVAIGVAAEFAGEYLSRSLERPIEAAREERLAKLTTEAEASRAAIAAANARTAEAELRLEQLRKNVEPRRVDQPVFLKLLEGQPKSRIEIVYVRDDADAFQLSHQILDAFKKASWDVEQPVPIKPFDTYPYSVIPSVMSARGQPRGVSIIKHEDPRGWTNDPSYEALQRAFQQSLIGNITVGGAADPQLPEGTLRVVVAPR
jgi:hypothetical protein